MKNSWIHKNITKVILESMSYSGSKGEEKILSASGLSSDILPLYLKYKHGTKENGEDFKQSHIGTLIHKSLAEVFEDKSGYIPEKRLLVKNFYKDWTLSGEPDLVVEKTANLEKVRVIFDWKTYKLKKLNLIKDTSSKEHEDLAVQLGVYALLTSLSSKKKIDRTECYVAVMVKDATRFGYNPSPDLTYVKINHKSEEEIRELFKAKADAIDKHIEEGTEPEECKFLGWSAPMRGAKKEKLICKLFCDVNHKCPYYFSEEDKHRINKNKVMDFLSRI